MWWLSRKDLPEEPRLPGSTWKTQANGVNWWIGKPYSNTKLLRFKLLLTHTPIDGLDWLIKRDSWTRSSLMGKLKAEIESSKSLFAHTNLFTIIIDRMPSFAKWKSLRLQTPSWKHIHCFDRKGKETFAHKRISITQDSGEECILDLWHPQLPWA